MTEKAALRKAVRAAFPGDEERDRQSGLICEHLLDWQPLRDAKRVFGYLPMAREADILPVLRWVQAQGKQLALPLCGHPPEMTFHQVEELEALRPGIWGIPEPDPAAPRLLPRRGDVILVPCEAMDMSGNRLGKGGGYYDRFLAEGEATAIAICLKHQLVDRVPTEAGDIPLRLLCTENGIFEAESIKAP